MEKERTVRIIKYYYNNWKCKLSRPNGCRWIPCLAGTVEADCADNADGITYGNTGTRPRALCDRFSATGWTPTKQHRHECQKPHKFFYTIIEKVKQNTYESPEPQRLAKGNYQYHTKYTTTTNIHLLRSVIYKTDNKRLHTFMLYTISC